MQWFLEKFIASNKHFNIVACNNLHKMVLELLTDWAKSLELQKAHANNSYGNLCANIKIQWDKKAVTR